MLAFTGPRSPLFATGAPGCWFPIPEGKINDTE